MHDLLSAHLAAHYQQNPTALFPLRRLTALFKATIPNPGDWPSTRIRAELQAAGYVVGKSKHTQQLMIVGLARTAPAWRVNDQGWLEQVCSFEK